MPEDLHPEHLLDSLKKGRLAPVYLFYGPGEFRMEQVLSEVRKTFLPEETRDFNLHIFYGDGSSPADILDAARSLPFMASNRLVIVRRTEDIPPKALETFIPYLDAPVESTCLIFVSSKTDFKKKFYKKVRGLRGAVNFRSLYDNQVLPWIKRTANDLGLTIEENACVYLQKIVGSRLRDLYSELEKLYLRYGNRHIGVREIEDLSIHSRIFTIFELMDQISLKRRGESISVLNRFLEEEGVDAVFQIIGMLNRQICLILQAKSIIEGGGRPADVAKRLKVRDFIAKALVKQSGRWSMNGLERAVHMLYLADGLIKSGSQNRLVLENLLLSF